MLLRDFLDEYDKARVFAPYYAPGWRPTWARAIGALLHPEAVTAAWHAADCPPRLDVRSLPFGTWVRWRVGMVLRGARF